MFTLDPSLIMFHVRSIPWLRASYQFKIHSKELAPYDNFPSTIVFPLNKFSYLLGVLFFCIVHIAHTFKIVLSCRPPQPPKIPTSKQLLHLRHDLIITFHSKPWCFIGINVDFICHWPPWLSKPNLSYLPKWVDLPNFNLVKIIC